MADLNEETNENNINNIIINNDDNRLNPCRCPECYLIPSISMYEEENKLKLRFKCPNNHEYKEEYESLYKKSKIDFENIECKICNNKKLKNKFYICVICNNFYCKKCRNEHRKENSNHLCININKYDSRCKIHNKDLVGYYKEENKNYCDYCPKDAYEFNRHKLIYEKEMNEYLNKINNYENQINNNNQELNLFVKKIEELLKTIKNMIKTSQNNQSTEINFQKELINTYNYMENQKNLNYQIIENVRNIMKLPIKIKLNENINNIIKKKNILYNNFINEIKCELGIIKQFDNFQNFKFENMNNIKTLNNNYGNIVCIKTLDDGRIAAGDQNSNLVIYNKETFNPDIIIKNNLGNLFNFVQLKNKNLACTYHTYQAVDILKIIKIKSNNEYEDIQIINNAHDKNGISKIIELQNENLITFSLDYSFKIWKLNNNNQYEKIYEFKDSNYLSDGLEIKDNEIILYAVNTNPNSLVFYNLNKNEKIRTLNNLNLMFSCIGERIIKINNDEVAIAGDKKVYLIDIKNYLDNKKNLILHEIDYDCCNYCILKLSNKLFLTGDAKGTITQYKIENNKIIKESYKNKSHENEIYSIFKFNGMIISGGYKSNGIKIWKK